MSKAAHLFMKWVAARYDAAILAGKMSADHAGYVTIDMGSGDSAVIHNDAGKPSYSEVIDMKSLDELFDFGADFGISEFPGEVLPTDPLELISKDARIALEQFCEGK